MSGNAKSKPTPVRVVRAVYDSVQELKEFSNRGRIGRLANIRELIVPGLPYIVVYRVSQYQVSVVRILHGVQQWP